MNISRTYGTSKNVNLFIYDCRKLQYYVLLVPFQKMATHMFPSGGITNKGQFKLEFFNVISPFRIKRNNEKIVCFCLFFVICFCLLFSCLFVWGFLPCFMLVFLVAVVIIVIYLIFTFVLVLFHIVFFIFYYVISKKAKTFLGFVLYFLRGKYTRSRIYGPEIFSS